MIEVRRIRHQIFEIDSDNRAEAILKAKAGQFVSSRDGGVAYFIEVKEVLKEIPLIPRDQWPLWAKALAQLSTPEDKGIGDVVARMIGDERSEKFKAWYLVTFGKKCGCNGRQNLWNTKYPLNLKAN